MLTAWGTNWPRGIELVGVPGLRRSVAMVFKCMLLSVVALVIGSCSAASKGVVIKELSREVFAHHPTEYLQKGSLYPPHGSYMEPLAICT